MIKSSKFNIGQKVKHKLLEFIGIIIDIDPEYSLNNNKEKKKINNTFIKSPWYHVIIEDDNGYPIHTYLAEEQLFLETQNKNNNKSILNNLYKIIKKKFKIKN